MPGACKERGNDGGDGRADDAVEDGDFCDGGVGHSLGNGEEGDVEGSPEVGFSRRKMVGSKGVSEGKQLEGIRGGPCLKAPISGSNLSPHRAVHEFNLRPFGGAAKEENPKDDAKDVREPQQELGEEEVSVLGFVCDGEEEEVAEGDDEGESGTG